MNRRLFPAWLAIFAAIACVALGVPAHAQAGELRTVERKLDNGLTVIVREDHRAPTAAQIMLYKVGAIDESGGHTGVSHVLEHMMFKGTPKYPGGEFSRQLAAMGGRENAFTTRDYTAYYQQIPAAGLERIMQLEADRMNNLDFGPEDFARELQVVMEERRLRVDDQPPARLHEQLLAHAFVSSPARTPVIGWMDDLKGMQIEDVRDWYRRWYRPNNAVLVVVGDVDAEQVFAAAAANYRQLAPGNDLRRRPVGEPEQHGRRTVELRAPAKSPYLVMAFRVPGLEAGKVSDPDSKDAFALAMLAAVLDGDENGRLNQALVRKSRIATQVGASYDFSGRAPALFTVSATPATGVDAGRVEAALLAQIERVARDGVSETELERFRIQYLADRIYQRDSVFSQAMEIIGLEAIGMSWRDAEPVLDRIRRVTPAEVQSVAARMFSERQLTVARLFAESSDAGTPPVPPAEPGVSN